MKCPVCKTDILNSDYCTECGFDQLNTEFLNRADAEAWMQTVVWPYREKYWLSMKPHFVVENSILKKYSINSRVTILPFGITAVGCCVFDYDEEKENVEELIIPASVKVIKGGAFSGQEQLKHIHLPEGLKTIESIAFEGCGLQAIDLPNSVTLLEEGFCFCMAKINLKDTNSLFKIVDDCLIEISSGTLLHCWSNSPVIVIPDGVKRIGYRTFPFELDDHRTVILPDSVESIGEEIGFGIESITIPASVSKIECGAFDGVTQISVDKNNPFYEEKDGLLIEIDNNLIVAACDKDNEKLVIPRDVEGIAASAFSRCKNIGTIVIPNNIKQIGAFAFSFCEIEDIFCEHSCMPLEWHTSSFSLSGYKLSDAQIHWGTSWRYIHGHPRLI